jgi:transcriptional regulator with XRE-family HTH domain
MNQPLSWLIRDGGLADRLRDLRRATGMTGRQFAQHVGWPPPKISRLELGRQQPSAADIEAWADGAGADADTRAELHDMLAAAEVARREWRRHLALRGHAAVQADHRKLTENAQSVRVFELSVVPGLLQTRDYARHLFTTLAAFRDLPPEDVGAAVAERLARQQVMLTAGSGKTFSFIVAESALRWRPCPSDVMRAQLRYLLSVPGVLGVPLGIVPLDREWQTPLETSFTLYDDQAFVENYAGETAYSGDQGRVFGRVMDLLSDEAVTGEHARTLIQAALDALPQ